MKEGIPARGGALRRAARAAGGSLALLVMLAPAGRADWLQPDVSYREAQAALRAAQRDTAGHGADPARLDSLAVAQLRLGRIADATANFRRVLAIAPADPAAHGALGKLALHAGRLAEAESLLALAGREDAGVIADLYAAKLQRGDWKGAASLAAEANQPGRVEWLERLAETPPWRISGMPEEISVLWSRTQPLPLVRVKLEGQSVLMAIDTGAPDVLLDQSVARRVGVPMLSGQWSAMWLGAPTAVRGAIARRLEIGGVRIEQVPAGVLDLSKWTLLVNPQGERVAGILGLGLLRQFTPTIDWTRGRLLLRRPDAAPAYGPTAARVPFEIWGESELMVQGTIGGGRRMAMIVQTGIPGCGVAAPSEVFDEVGVKPGTVAKLVKSVGTMLQGRPWTEVGVPALSVGAVTRGHLTGWSGAMESGEMWRHGIRRDAIVSGDFFRGRRVTIDWTRRELVIEEKD